MATTEEVPKNLHFGQTSHSTIIIRRVPLYYAILEDLIHHLLVLCTTQYYCLAPT